jgi:hypothetical protein
VQREVPESRGGAPFYALVPGQCGRSSPGRFGLQRGFRFYGRDGAEEGKISYARVLERARGWGLEIAGGAVLGCPPLVPEVAWRSSRLSFLGRGST